MAMSGLDFICIDCEHAPNDRRGMDASLAMARALGLPALLPAGVDRLFELAIPITFLLAVAPGVQIDARRIDIAQRQPVAGFKPEIEHLLGSPVNGRQAEG